MNQNCNLIDYKCQLIAPSLVPTVQLFQKLMDNAIDRKSLELLYCSVRHGTARHCTALHCTVLYCTVLYRTVPYRTVPYCTVLHRIASQSHCFALHLHVQLSLFGIYFTNKPKRHVLCKYLKHSKIAKYLEHWAFVRVIKMCSHITVSISFRLLTSLIS